MDDTSFRQILDRLGLSWQGYAKVRKGVKKRICRHMQEHGYHNMEDYLHALNNPEILTAVERLFCVSISYFFRDRYLWKILEEKILPEMIRKYDESINVWSAGCALGQEVYSFAILWEMTKDRVHRLPRLFLRATDSNPYYLEKASVGAYHRSSLKGLPQEIKAQYLHLSEDGSNYLFIDYLKKDITWQLHDLMKQPPPAGKFQIIFLRNSLLTYYREGNALPVFLKIADRLEDGGILIIGCHEKIPSHAGMLSPLKSCSYIFQKI
jgi:chemotaxis protein methyltransferase CheR